MNRPFRSRFGTHEIALWFAAASCHKKMPGRSVCYESGLPNFSPVAGSFENRKLFDKRIECPRIEFVGADFSGLRSPKAIHLILHYLRPSAALFMVRFIGTIMEPKFGPPDSPQFAIRPEVHITEGLANSWFVDHCRACANVGQNLITATKLPV